MKLDPQKTIYLIDGSSFLYRAYYSMRPLHTLTGEPVQAVYGFCRMLKKIINESNPAYIALVWDSKGKTERHDEYADYKATRQAPPSDLFDQKEYIVELADLIGLTQLSQSGIEADDIMYSLAKEAEERGDNAVLITADKDMGQALTDKIYMYDTFKELLYTPKKFAEKMGFPVSKLPFYFSLLGDSSDNIPGVRGVGKVGAKQLVTQFDSLEDLYNNLDKVEKKRTRTALEQNKDNAFLSRSLFLLKYHDLGIEKDDLMFDAGQWANARELFEQLNFKTLLKDIGATVGDSYEEKIKRLEKAGLHTITTEKELVALCERLKRKHVYAMDTETTGLDPLRDPCIGISFAVKEDEAFYIPFGHKTDEQQLSQETVVKHIKPILEDPEYHQCLHNIKFDQHALAGLGIQLRGATFDTMIAAHLLLPEWVRIGLKRLSQQYFNEPMLTYAEVVKKNKYQDFSYVPLKLATLYAAYDSLQTLKLYRLFREEMRSIEPIKKQFEEIEMPLIQVLFEMEQKGIYLDVAQLQKLDKLVSAKLDSIQSTIIDMAGADYAAINLNSPRQVAQLLFEHLELPPQKKSSKKTGYSTDAEVLQALSSLHPIPGLIAQYRELAKLKSTYIDSLPQYVNPKTERVHTTYSQVATATGRLASSDPNLQNIPADSAGYGIEIRAAFKAMEDSVFLSADYSQIELRILAHLSGDKTLTDAFLHNRDIHAETAAGLFAVKHQEITHEQRQIGKRINFSILYGLTPYGLSKDLGISFSDAKQHIDNYFKQYPGVQDWMACIVEQTKKDGYVQTLWGRQRQIPGIYEENKTLYDEARRVAINTRVQGTAAEIMKVGMLQLRNQLAQKKSKAAILLQIHDELLLTVPVSEKAEITPLVRQILQNIVDWKIPLVVTVREGKDWKEVTK